MHLPLSYIVIIRCCEYKSNHTLQGLDVEFIFVDDCVVNWNKQ